MSTTSTTAAVFRAERWRIGLTYAVTLLENLFYLLYPWTIGLAIDGLLAGEGLRSLLGSSALSVQLTPAGSGQGIEAPRLCEFHAPL